MTQNSETAASEPYTGWTTTPFTERVGIRYPIVQGPFGGGRSSVELAAAVTTAGGLGSFGAVDLEPDGIAEVAAGIRRLTAGPFALNLWVPLDPALDPPPSSAQYAGAVALLRPHYDELGVEPPPFDEVVAGFARKFERQVAAVLAARPAVFSFIFGIPPDEVLRECRRLGIVTFGTATNVVEAEALAAADVDVIVASGVEAGGHRSSFLRPVAEGLALSALVPQVADRVDRPVVAVGGIADGRGAVAAFVLGAAGVQVGTAFLATPESAASPTHKAALVAPGERSTMLTRAFTGRYARGLVNRYVRAMVPHERALPAYPWQGRMLAPLSQAAARAGVADLMALWAGQNVPLVALRPAAEVMRFLVEDIDRVLRQTERLSRA